MLIVIVIVIRLLKKRRKFREPESVPNAWVWKSVPEEDILESTNPIMAKRAVVYSLHSPLEIKPVSMEHLRSLKNDNDNLKLLVGRLVIVPVKFVANVIVTSVILCLSFMSQVNRFLLCKRFSS